ncbi:MAG: hypothetical protein QMD09_10405 [Desulfatibacillaceae bacterium]|nr:hypothetical protein [Desulfatibacillaceae bacterium]
MRKLALILAALAAISCAVGSAALEKRIFESTRVERIHAPRSTWIVGPQQGSPLGPARFELRALVENDRLLFIQLAVDSGDYSWRLFSSAADESGNELDFVALNNHRFDPARRTSFQQETEKWAVRLSKNRLEEAAQEGLVVEALGIKGKSRIFIKPPYIQGFLRKLDFYLAWP